MPRLARFRAGGKVRSGFLVENEVHETTASWTEVLAAWAAVDGPAMIGCAGQVWAREEVSLLAPLAPDSRGVICVGMNYADHSDELEADKFAADLAHPVFFMKLAAATADPGAPLCLDGDASKEFDWEGELGVVIGRRVRHASPDEVADCIAGYTLVNDVTARDLQLRHSQWFIGKNYARSSPVGPWITPRSAVGYPPDLALTVTVNGSVKQAARTSEMITTIDDLVVVLSKCIELVPGDIIATGTPSGVGFVRTPPEYLSPGDVVRVSIDQLGHLENEIT